MSKFVVMNSKGEFGIESKPTRFGGNGTSKLNWTLDLHSATLFTKMTFDMINSEDKGKVIAKLNAEEVRTVRLTGENNLWNDSTKLQTKMETHLANLRKMKDSLGRSLTQVCNANKMLAQVDKLVK